MALRIGRSVGERIFINDNIIIRVASCTNTGVTLSFEADEDVSIDREEIRVKKLLGRMEERKVKGSEKLTVSGIKNHLKQVCEMHAENKNEAETLRLARLLPEFSLLSDEYILAIIDLHSN